MVRLRAADADDCLSVVLALLLRRPAAVQASFWSAMPRALRESPQRFAHNGAAAPRFAADTAVPLVLVVDDDEAIRSLVACRVLQLGYRVATPEDPHHAMM